MAQDSGPDRQKDAERKEQPEEERESIWTIPARYKGWYFGIFSIQIIIASIWLVRTAIVDESRNNISEILPFIWQGMAPFAISSATFALVIIDTWKTTMVFGTWLEETLEKRRQRQIKAAEERGLARGRAELQKEWQDWNRRREAAVAAGKDFTEPPPNGIAPEPEQESDSSE